MGVIKHGLSVLPLAFALTSGLELRPQHGAVALVTANLLIPAATNVLFLNCECLAFHATPLELA
jgi:hypothetical protein